jgi:hypothetical protein
MKEVRDEFRALRQEQYQWQHEALHSYNAWMTFALFDLPGSYPMLYFFWFGEPLTGNTIDWWASKPSMTRTMSDPDIYTFLSPMQLFQCLNVSPRSIIDDVDIVLQKIGRIDASAQAQAQQLLSSQEFLRWIGPSRTETLYVQGNLRVANSARISALSAVCATLSLNLSKNTDSVVLLFICGLHEASNEPIGGPKGLIRSLIAQLLLAGLDLKLDFISTRSYFELIKAHDLRSLAQTFRCLIESLPCNLTVVCILDGLTRFESSPWLAELEEVVYTLNEIIRNRVLRPVVKLLVTTPFANSLHLGKLIQAHQTMLRPTFAAGGRRISARSMADRTDRLREYRMAMERGVDSEDDSDDCYARGFEEDSSDDGRFGADDDDDDDD